MLSKLLNFRRRTKSKYVDDKAVEDFTRVCRAQGFEMDYEPTSLDPRPAQDPHRRSDDA